MKSINPYTGEVITVYPTDSAEEVEKAIKEAHEAYLSWRQTEFSERSEKLRKAAEILEERKEQYANLMVGEMGKVITEARSEISKCAWVCNYYAEHGPTFLKPETIETDARHSYVTFQPLGVVLAVMPWNFPFWQVFRFAAPALMAGNAGLLKHASNVPGCGQAIEEILEDAGFPKGLFRHLLISSDKVEPILRNPLVKAATLTGSEPAGKSVASIAGSEIKKTVLELGGSDPYLILEDADLEQAATACAESRLLNAGQSCIGAKRFIPVEAVFDEFLQLFKEKMVDTKVGDPGEEDMEVGPLASHELRDELHKQVIKSVEAGAVCILGGEVPDEEGAFYPPTILTNVKPGMPAYEEELFGPVASVLKARDEAHAIELANDTKFGLGAAVFTQDRARGEEIAAHKLQAGNCFVNAFVKSDPRLPFGGVKTSGYGRELSRYGMLEFVNMKTVYIS